MREILRAPAQRGRNGPRAALAAALCSMALGCGPDPAPDAATAAVAPVEVDPELWARQFPRQLESFGRTRLDGQRTAYGGSEPYDKLDEKPFLRKAWAGHAFAVEYNEERGHHYAQIDQARSARTRAFAQPGACVNCHTGNFVALMQERGWEQLNKTPYDELRDHLGEIGMSCADCHDPVSMKLRLTRPALINALEREGVDWRGLERSQMRSLVCAQCHVEYYFRGEDRALVFPWSFGRSIENIEQHYDAYAFKDWEHALTKAPMVKVQHPEYELFSTGFHASIGVACADCHMPSVGEGDERVTDHWVRSPLSNLVNACSRCHREPEGDLRQRVLTVQNRTNELKRAAESAIGTAIDAIVAAMTAGVGDAELMEARRRHRRAQMRWDFVDAENSAGFHSPREAARILRDASAFAQESTQLAEAALAASSLGSAAADL